MLDCRKHMACFQPLTPCGVCAEAIEKCVRPVRIWLPMEGFYTLRQMLLCRINLTAAQITEGNELCATT